MGAAMLVPTVPREALCSIIMLPTVCELGVTDGSLASWVFLGAYRSRKEMVGKLVSPTVD